MQAKVFSILCTISFYRVSDQKLKVFFQLQKECPELVFGRKNKKLEYKGDENNNKSEHSPNQTCVEQCINNNNNKTPEERRRSKNRRRRNWFPSQFFLQAFVHVILCYNFAHFCSHPNNNKHVHQTPSSPSSSSSSSTTTNTSNKIIIE